MENLYPVKQPINPIIAYSDPAAVAAAEAAKARIQAAYIMAIQKPRNEMEARDRILTACKRTEFAGRAEFAKPIGNTTVRGPSIRFAELALREWGNVLTEVQVLYEDVDIRRVRVSALDLETNAQFTKDIQIKKTIERRSKKGREEDVLSERKNTNGQIVYILRATDDEVYVKESAWASKALRNEGLRLIPTDIIEEGMQQARKTIAERAYKDPEGEKKKLLDAFSGLGIRPKELAKYIKHSIDTLSPAEVVSLRTVYQSIRDGETTWAEYINETTPEQSSGNIEPESIDTSKFDDLVKSKTVPEDGSLDRFIELTANAQASSTEHLKVMAAENFENFWGAYEKWRMKNMPNQAWKCPHCEFVAQSERGLKKHITQQHEEEPKAQPKQDEIPPPEAIEVPADDFNEEAEKAAKIKAINEGYADFIEQVKFQLNVKQYPLEELNLDMLQEVIDRCKDMAGENRF